MLRYEARICGNVVKVLNCFLATFGWSAQDSGQYLQYLCIEGAVK